MKRVFASTGMVVLVLVLVLGLSAGAQATLIPIGTATYNSSDYGLIYDDDLGIVWLDYTNPVDAWQNQVNWATGLNSPGVLTYNLDPGITVSWTGDWRLPQVIDIGNDGCNWSYSGTDCGYNVDTSTGEMAHLFYDELGNLAAYDTNGNGLPGWWLTNTTGPFTNLQADYYWSGTEYALDTNYAWHFNFFLGNQNSFIKAIIFPTTFYAMAVRPGDVSIGSGGPSPVPEPATIFLLGSGLVGLTGLRKKLKTRTS